MRILGDKLQTFTHWFGWTLALVASVLFFIFDFLDWLTRSNPINSKTQIWFFIFLLVAIGGTVISFFSRVRGALIMMAGGFGMVLYYYFSSGWMDAGLMIVYGLPFVLPSFLLLTVKK